MAKGSEFKNVNKFSIKHGWQTNYKVKFWMRIGEKKLAEKAAKLSHSNTAIQMDWLGELNGSFGTKKSYTLICIFRNLSQKHSFSTIRMCQLSYKVYH